MQERISAAHQNGVNRNTYGQQMMQRNQFIDFIRGFSILSVILLHCSIHLPIDSANFSNTCFKLLLRSGYYGVMIFFVVSGFLITRTSIRKWNKLQNIRLGQFYLMRFARIMPSLFALLTLLSLLHLMRIPGFAIQTTSLEHALFSVFTLQINWLEAKTGYLPANWDILWSLSIEEMFYLFFPLLCTILRKQKYLILVMLIFIFLGPLARIKFYTDNDYWSDYSYLSCMDGIAMGCLAAILANKLRSKPLLISLFAIGFLLFGFVFFFRKLAFDLGIITRGLNVTILDMGIACILIASQFEFKLLALLRWFGKNSYEIYLTHSFVVLFAAGFLYQSHQSIWLIASEYLFIVIGSGLLGQILATYYSIPLNRYIREKTYQSTMSYSS